MVVFNVLDAPRSISLSQLLRTIEQWAAWSWGGGPGAILGFLACVVAFSKNPSLPREPEKGPPSSDQDDVDEDEDLGAQPRQHPLTAEKLHIHGIRDLSDCSVSPKRPDVALTDASLMSGWKRICPKISFGSNSQMSLSAPSRNFETSSETSANLRRTKPSFQVISLANANYVKSNSAKPQHPAMATPTKFVPHYQPSHLSTSNRSDDCVGSPAYPSSPNPSFIRAFHIPTQQSYPMPVQIPRDQSSNCNPFLHLPPVHQRINVQSLTGQGHFDAIHQLRERE